MRLTPAHGNAWTPTPDFMSTRLGRRVRRNVPLESFLKNLVAQLVVYVKREDSARLAKLCAQCVLLAFRVRKERLTARRARLARRLPAEESASPANQGGSPTGLAGASASLPRRDLMWQTQGQPSRHHVAQARTPQAPAQKLVPSARKGATSLKKGLRHAP